ncbi:MAG: cytochrome b N-terminal domain-containing protein [Anaerolineae bacterium]|jgi:cytochrome b6
MEAQSRAKWWTRMWDWFDERLDVRIPLEAFLKKPVPKHAIRWYFCLGGITFALFAIQGVTGILLSLYYRPTPGEAYESILFIMNNVRFGWLIRSIHSWSASLMIAFCVAHMLRVFITGSYKNPRELNWVAGVVLLLLTLAFGFTGYLLPWDQKALWGSTVGSEILGIIPGIGGWLLGLLRGGMEITGLTLTRFYGIHMLVLPVLAFIFLAVHFIIIRRQGISGPL